MEHFVGIDVSLELSSLCVLDVTGKVIREAKVASEPEALVAFLRGLDLVIGRVGLEAAPLSQWLYDGLRPGFDILDADDTKRLVKRTMKVMNIDPGDSGEGRDPLKQLCNRIAKFKDNRITPDEAPARVEAMIAQARTAHATIDPDGMRMAARVYLEYQRRLREANAADFGDLLLWPTKAMQRDEVYRCRWQQRFDCVLADEYQDVCYVQYAWLRLLCAVHGEIFCVGDDDQSVYSFRGADITFIRCQTAWKRNPLSAPNRGSDSFPLQFCGDLAWCSWQEPSMGLRFGFASLIPLGLEVDSVDDGETTLVVTARSNAATASCPLCGVISRRVQSHYVRQPSDLPCSGRRVRLRLLVRRFRCGVRGCLREVFAERFDTTVLAERARRTGRLEEIVHHLGLAMGGRPGAGFAQRLMLPVSNDTLLRVVRRRALPRTEKLAVIGIDDWAYRRNHRYGTIVCDLERRRVVALLPDREQATAETWLRQHPGISIVSRDRGGGYGEALARALPNAIQVADRWHLIENASAAFLDAIRLSMRAVRSALGAATIDPALLTAAELLQYEGFLRREDTTRQIRALKASGHSIKEIVRRTQHSRKLVRQTVRGVRGDVFRVRQSSLDAYLPGLDAEWTSGCRNGAELWRRLTDQGFRGSLRVVSEWTTRRRRADQMQAQGLQKAPSARTLARLMGMGRDHLSKADTVIVAAVEAGVPGLADARSLVERFQVMIRTKAAAELDGWIEQARVSLIAPLARGVAKDVAAIRAAITEPWSNGQTEGQITRLKLVKRQMYGRAKLDLLEARLIGAV